MRQVGEYSERFGVEEVPRSAFKVADVIATGECPLSGAKRTWLLAPHMIASGNFLLYRTCLLSGAKQT